MNRPWVEKYDYWIHEAYRENFSLVTDILHWTTKFSPDKVAVDYQEVELKYRDLWRQARGFATALRSRGVQKGDHVGIMLPNSPEFAVAFYGVLYAGAVVVPFNPTYTPREIEWLLDYSQVSTLIVFTPLVEKLTEKTKARLKSIIFVNPPGMSASGDKIEFHSLIQEGCKAPFSKVQMDVEEPAVIIYTGGTTGRPKGAVLKHRTLYAGTFVFAMWFKGLVDEVPVEERRMLCLPPFFHIWGMGACLTTAIMQRMTLVIMPRYSKSGLLGYLEKHKITIFPAPPVVLNDLLKDPHVDEYRLNERILLIQFGSAPSSPELSKKMLDLGISFIEGYGLTEASVTHLQPVFGHKKPGSIGLPVPNVNVKVVDLETGEKEVDVGEPGELCVSGPQVTDAYWSAPEETALTIRDGWLYTGDVVRMDEDGYFYVIDRKKEMIIHKGFNVYPQEVDNVIMAHPKVLESCTIGIPDERTGEKVKSYVVPLPGQQVTVEEVIEHCQKYLAPYKVPEIVEFRSALPKSAMGKILRKEVKAMGFKGAS